MQAAKEAKANRAAQAAQPANAAQLAASPAAVSPDAAAVSPDAAPSRDVAMDMQAMIGALSALATAQTAAQLRQALSASAPLQQHSPIAEARQSA